MQKLDCLYSCCAWGKQADEEPGPRDTEEYIEVYRVGIPELKEIVKSGDMTLPSMTTCFLALDRLAELEML